MVSSGQRNGFNCVSRRADLGKCAIKLLLVVGHDRPCRRDRRSYAPWSMCGTCYFAPNICSSPPSWLDRQRAAPFLKERDTTARRKSPLHSFANENWLRHVARHAVGLLRRLRRRQRDRDEPRRFVGRPRSSFQLQHEDFRQHGRVPWFAPYDLDGGGRIAVQIDGGSGHRPGGGAFSVGTPFRPRALPCRPLFITPFPSGMAQGP
jgi:hypothetical protein